MEGLRFRRGDENSVRDPDFRVLSDADLETAMKEGQEHG
jgi:hypothetical protein